MEALSNIPLHAPQATLSLSLDAIDILHRPLCSNPSLSPSTPSSSAPLSTTRQPARPHTITYKWCQQTCPPFFLSVGTSTRRGFSSYQALSSNSASSSTHSSTSSTFLPTTPPVSQSPSSQSSSQFLPANPNSPRGRPHSSALSTPGILTFSRSSPDNPTSHRGQPHPNHTSDNFLYDANSNLNTANANANNKLANAVNIPASVPATTTNNPTTANAVSGYPIVCYNNLLTN